MVRFNSRQNLFYIVVMTYCECIYNNKILLLLQVYYVLTHYRTHCFMKLNRSICISKCHPMMVLYWQCDQNENTYLISECMNKTTFKNDSRVSVYEDIFS